MRGQGRTRVGEVNHTPEFRNTIEPTGIDLPARIIDYVLAVANRPVNAAGFVA